MSTAKMERMNLLLDRSDFLLQGAGGRAYSTTRPDGVKFTSRNYYVVYGWIPVQCIVTYFTLTRFRNICKERKIQPDELYKLCLS